jgi:hypothetical protein
MQFAWLKYFTYQLVSNYKQHILSPARVRKVCCSLPELCVKLLYLNFCGWWGAWFFFWGGGRNLWYCMRYFKFSRRRVWYSELSSGIYCCVKWLSTDVSEVRTASIIRDAPPAHSSGSARQIGTCWTQHQPGTSHPTPKHQDPIHPIQIHRPAYQGGHWDPASSEQHEQGGWSRS